MKNVILYKVEGDLREVVIKSIDSNDGYRELQPFQHSEPKEFDESSIGLIGDPVIASEDIISFTVRYSTKILPASVIRDEAIKLYNEENEEPLEGRKQLKPYLIKAHEQLLPKALVKNTDVECIVYNNLLLMGTSSVGLSDIISEFLINLINLALDKKIIGNKPRLQTLVLGRENSTLSDLLTDLVVGKTDSIFDMSVVTGNVDLHAEETEESPAEKVSFKGDWVLETEELYSLINDQDMRVCKIVLFTEDLEFKIDKRGILSGFKMPELEEKSEDPSADLYVKVGKLKPLIVPMAQFLDKAISEFI